MINTHCICLLGPLKNPLEHRLSKFPELYKKTNGAGFPSINLMINRKDRKDIR